MSSVLLGILLTADGFAMPATKTLRRLEMDIYWVMTQDFVSPYQISILVGRWEMGDVDIQVDIAIL